MSAAQPIAANDGIDAINFVAAGIMLDKGRLSILKARVREEGIASFADVKADELLRGRIEVEQGRLRALASAALGVDWEEIAEALR